MATPRIINEISHDTRATLQHEHSRAGYKEIVRDISGVITDIIIWVDNTKTRKIRETHLARVLGQLSTVTKKQYDKDGNLVELFTQAYDRDGTGKVVDVRLDSTIFPTGIGGWPIGGAGSVQIQSDGVALGTANTLDFLDASVAVVGSVATIGTGAGASPTFTGACFNTIAVGDLVYAAGSGKAMALADPFNTSKMPAVGIVVSKPTPSSCVVQTSGVVSGLSGLIAGQYVFISRAGRPTTTPPTPGPGETLAYQPLGLAIDTDSMVLFLSLITTRVHG